ncbi:sugar ABC transporter substrate-binding protein [Niameybacter massiliensis]|uniref:sugar ABC transporter substrate-binding protein n=1 Tax=Niameybacter massiliensis TaxID=1658108 RepID=UPI0006B64C4D|nr:extracellular solute-binding protein [Niameybacter massiliensis]
MFKQTRKIMKMSLFLSIFLVGCTTAKDIEVVTPEPQREKLVLWSYYETQAQKESLDLLIEEFNTIQEDYLLSWVYVPMTDFSKRLAMGVTENELPDLVIIDNPDMPAYIQLGIFEELNDYFEAEDITSTYYENVWQSVEHEGKYYGLPFCCNNLALIYNKEDFEAEGLTPPSTWEEFIACAEALTTEDRYGFAMSAIAGEQSLFQMLPWILSTGEDIEALGGEKTKEAFELIHTLVEEAYMDINCINWSQNDVARKFIEGQAAMMENGPWVLPMLEEANVEYGIVRLPIQEVSLMLTGGENLCILKEKNVEGALTFLDYYRRPEVMQRVSQKASVLPPSKEEAKAFADKNEMYQVFVEQMDDCISRTSFSNWKGISGKLSESIYGLFTGEMTVDAAALHLQ